MKVAILAPTPPPSGGIASWTARMMDAKLKNGWEVVVVDERAAKSNIYVKSKSVFTEIKRCFRIWGDLKNVLKDDDVKVVHSCIPSATKSMMREYVCALIAKKYKKKFIIHFRCTVPALTKGKVGRFMLKRLCNKSDLVMTLNKQTNEYIKQITNTPYKLIPNFISENELVEGREINKELKTVIYVGGVVKNKGAFELMQVAERMQDITFRCFGSVREDVAEYANEHNLKNVVFEGERPKDEVRSALRKADAFVFLSHTEGFSNALCEAMAAGLPVVATPAGANDDMIEGKGGYIVPIERADEATAALEKIKSYEDRKRMSEFNIEKVRGCYTEGVVIPQYVDVYEMLLNK